MAVEGECFTESSPTGALFFFQVPKNVNNVIVNPKDYNQPQINVKMVSTVKCIVPIKRFDFFFFTAFRLSFLLLRAKF